ncbi:molybdopterin molybdotransferase MoeA [Paramaledivibacter caminithermalis]|jgi:molybdopterin molybdotransferase|uniref:Molybdopterin molybdenumtransferase n=1 Tax=Paramaledivibacter caminithermalis (strain DSM 15212 / CIP 107654 / DViRD3) TaxID=1121301 RepID=A0A1M6KWD6_PARC5|nr:gephyrin-like molybdotransferase Glp [Paramaledivibacter caminithermalis]SHJ63204.1 molybdopterin molybdochelatase [Paramaledivibacter caminithermalis DSM 15212]
MKMFNVHSVEKAKSKLKEYFKGYELEVEMIDISKAVGRILATDIFSSVNVPHFRRSTVDGYAVISKDTYGASESLPAFLQVIGEVHMGKEAEIVIHHDKTAYVPTGGMIPDGADSVVMVEYTEKLDEENIAINKPVSTKENMIDIGDDIKKNQKVLTKGLRLRPQDIGVLSSVGVDKVSVFKLPTIAIISTGDEIVDSSQNPKLGQIRDINTYTLSAMAKEAGCIVTKKIVIKDEFQILKNTLEECINDNDIVIISGGSSVGTKDITGKVINTIGEPGVFVHGIAIKPGKPTILAKVKNKAVFGLPGQPVSAMIVFKIFVEYFIKYIQNIDAEIEPFLEAFFTSHIHSAQGRETYQMVTLEKDGSEWLAKPVYGKSGMITLMSKAKGYIKIEADKEGVVKGEKVRVIPI